MDQNPLHRLNSLGATALSPVELLAVALMKDESDCDGAMHTAREIMKSIGGIRELRSITKAALMEAAGMDPLRRAQFEALLELGRRTAGASRDRVDKIEKPDDVAAIFSDLKNERQEHFCALLLDTKNHVIGRQTIHIGTLSASIVGAREFFRQALLENAAAIIAVHNHPSGDPTPSPEDYEVTKQLAAIGKQLEIPLLDHVIIGENEFKSMQRLGAIS